MPYVNKKGPRILQQNINTNVLNLLRSVVNSKVCSLPRVGGMSAHVTVK